MTKWVYTVEKNHFIFNVFTSDFTVKNHIRLNTQEVVTKKIFADLAAMEKYIASMTITCL